MADRVAALEAKVGDKSIEEQFLDQSQLIDRLFIYRFDEFDKKWDAKLDTRLGKLETKLEAKFEEKLGPIRTDLASLKDDMAIVKDVLKVILKRLP